MEIPLNEFLYLREQMPLADVRSQAEYAAGHMRSAVNVPILTDKERVIVGTTFKNFGQKEAIRQGFRLVGPRLDKLISETEEIACEKELLVHCWRGGLRSKNFCQFIGMAGIKSRSLIGGYKTYRRAALASFEEPLQLILLTGLTGSGKSEVLRSISARGEQVLDLERMACHKGSVFGGLQMPHQPTTEQFQNDLFEAVRALDRSRPVWVEDESIAIGRIFLPATFWLQMTRSPIIQMDVSKETRVKRLCQEYGDANKQVFLELMSRITKKLGGQNYKNAREKLMSGDWPATIDILLTYYDKAYRESIAKRKDRIRTTLLWDGTSMAEFSDSVIEAGIAMSSYSTHA